MSQDLILLIIPTIASVSFTPGLCMTLAFTLGLSIGYKQTLFGRIERRGSGVCSDVFKSWLAAIARSYLFPGDLIGRRHILVVFRYPYVQ